MSGSKSVSSSPMENLRPVGQREGPELSQNYLLKHQKTKFGPEHHFIGAGNGTSSSMTSRSANDQVFGFGSDAGMRTASLFMEGNRTSMKGFHHDNGLFSSSLSELLDRKCL